MNVGDCGSGHTIARMKRLAILTAGGDCPGLNAVIRGVTARAAGRHGAEVVGILDGWDGLMEGQLRPLDRDAVRGILQRGGTILGTSRRDPYVHGKGAASVTETLEREGIDAVVVIGGDGTLRTALRLSAEGVPIVGVPKTIDNDIAATDVTFGFDTAVQIATEAIDRITTTAESHDRVMLVEVMGRTRGWIATYAGIAAGADAILVPEEPYDLEAVADVVRRRADRRQALLGRRRRGGHRATCREQPSPRRSTRSASSGSAACRCSSRHGSRSSRGSSRA